MRRFEDKVMINKNTVNVVILGLSGIILISFLELLKVSGKTDYSTFLADILFIVASYLMAYLLITSVSGSRKSLLDFVPLIIISICGSFLFSLYMFVSSIYSDWNYLSKNPDDWYRHINEVFPVVILFTPIYFTISGFMNETIRILINKREGKFIS